MGRYRRGLARARKGGAREREKSKESSDSSKAKVRELVSIIVSESEEGRMSIPPF
ncbi:hypothetical protein A2U01_0111680, partial [Trifolium medium]|nr:hypothetical protein [Trifolium medium]